MHCVVAGVIAVSVADDRCPLAGEPPQGADIVNERKERKKRKEKKRKTL